MYWIDAYSKMYQKAQGFPLTVLSKLGKKKGYLSMKPTTRAAYDLSMRENSIDGIITMEDIATDLKAGNIFYIDTNPTELYIIQSCSYWEQQPDTRNINAIKVNCLVTVQRRGFKDENSEKEEWITIYENIYGSNALVLKDGKNFNAGIEVATQKGVQIPKMDIEGNFYNIKETDRCIVVNLVNPENIKKINVESTDSSGISGIVRIQGTQDMRND